MPLVYKFVDVHRGSFLARAPKPELLPDNDGATNPYYDMSLFWPPIGDGKHRYDFSCCIRELYELRRRE